MKKINFGVPTGPVPVPAYGARMTEVGFAVEPLPAAPYSGMQLSRAGDRRDDAEWVAARRADPRSRLHPLFGGECLVAGDRRGPVVLRAADFDPDSLVLLGVDDDGVADFAVDLSDLEVDEALAAAQADAVTGLRSLFDRLPATQAGLLACARGVLAWNRDQRFCGRCGAPTVPRAAGFMRACTGEACGRLLFPRIEPAVIVLVETTTTPRQCLLARHRASSDGSFSLLAGFVEIGESLETAVRREIAEEVGVRLTDVRYAGSQPWPFPSGIMLAFRARAEPQDPVVDGDEISEARWFGRDDLLSGDGAVSALGRPDSIDHLLLAAWLAESEDTVRSGGS